MENGNKDGIEENLLRAMINNSSILDAIHRRRGSRTFCNLNLLLANPFPNVEAIPRLHNFFGFIVLEVILQRTKLRKSNIDKFQPRL